MSRFRKKNKDNIAEEGMSLASRMARILRGDLSGWTSIPLDELSRPGDTPFLVLMMCSPIGLLRANYGLPPGSGGIFGILGMLNSL